MSNDSMQMIYNGFSQRDCEAHWKCPNCNKDYGDWGFFQNALKGGDTFVCECGTSLIVPR